MGRSIAGYPPGRDTPYGTNCEGFGASFSNALPLRILFAGGCHVCGFPIDPDDAFPRVAVQHLSGEFSIEAGHISNLAMSKVRMLITQCRSFHPDVLVLQLGHYESGLWLQKRMNKLFHRMGRPHKNKTNNAQQAESMSKTWANPGTRKLQSAFRFVGDKLLTFLLQ